MLALPERESKQPPSPGWSSSLHGLPATPGARSCQCCSEPRHVRVSGLFPFQEGGTVGCVLRAVGGAVRRLGWRVRNLAGALGAGRVRRWLRGGVGHGSSGGVRRGGWLPKPRLPGWRRCWPCWLRYPIRPRVGGCRDRGLGGAWAAGVCRINYSRRQQTSSSVRSSLRGGLGGFRCF